jgi:hypothetical protein
MPFEYHDIHSDFINLNATQSIHLVSNSIFINDIDIVSSLTHLTSPQNNDETNTLLRIITLESNINTLLENYSCLQKSLQTEISDIKNMMQSQTSIFDNNLQANISNEITRINDIILSHKSLLDEKIAEHDNSLQQNVSNEIARVNATILSHKSLLDEKIAEHDNSLQQNVSNEIARVNATILSHKSLLDEKIAEHDNSLQTKVNTVELNLNQITENVKSYMETIDNIHKKFKYVESNQIDIMSIMTRVITLENANKELVHTNESLCKMIEVNNDKIDKLAVLVDNLLHPVVNTDVEILDNIVQPQPEQSQPEQSQPEQSNQHISRAKSIVGKKRK